MRAYLVDDVATWDDRFTKQQPAGQRWGTRETQHMLTKLPEQSTPFYAAGVDAIHGPKSQQAVKDFQAWSNQIHGTSLKSTGNVDADTRKEIIKAYMALDGTSLPPGTTTDHHGCGKSHLADPTADNVDDEKNRRIEVYFFEGKIKPPPVAKCPPGGCEEYPIWRDGIDDEIDLDAAGADGRVAVAILIVDELGVPLRNHGAHMKRADGQEFDAETDGDGKVHPLLLPGESIELTIDDCQEVGVGDSITTPSGQHFGADMPGPRP
ncbi:MAG TPA: peptidoglycan-binding domain-containing protein [Kofleriaceae bacterium]|nr:peptidoglycan-binding domain-containing protein [Kofleriaceae bacterium]